MRTLIAILALIIGCMSGSAAGPTFPTASGGKSVTVDSSGNLTAPANFLSQNLIAGANVTLTPSGNKITIASTGGGGGGSLPSTSAGLAALLSDETGSGSLVFAVASVLTGPTLSAPVISGGTYAGGTFNSPTIATPTFTGALTLPTGVRQTFQPNSSLPGLNVGTVAGDPSSLTGGDVWHNSTSSRIRIQQGGVASDIGNGYQYDYTTAAVTYGASLAIDLQAAQYQTIVLTGDTTLTTANRPSSGARAVTVFFSASGAQRTVTLNGSWKNYNSSASIVIPSGKEAFLTLFATGSAEANVAATFGVQQ